MPSMSWVSGPDKQPELAIAVHASTEASGLTNHVTIAGGGAPTPASTVNPLTVSSTPAPFWDLRLGRTIGPPTPTARSTRRQAFAPPTR